MEIGPWISSPCRQVQKRLPLPFLLFNQMRPLHKINIDYRYNRVLIYVTDYRKIEYSTWFNTFFLMAHYHGRFNDNDVLSLVRKDMKGQETETIRVQKQTRRPGSVS